MFTFTTTNINTGQVHADTFATREAMIDWKLYVENSDHLRETTNEDHCACIADPFAECDK